MVFVMGEQNIQAKDLQKGDLLFYRKGWKPVLGVQLLEDCVRFKIGVLWLEDSLHSKRLVKRDP